MIIFIEWILEKQIEGAKEFVAAIESLTKLFERAETETQTNVGLWREGGQLSLADVMAGPCKYLVLLRPQYVRFIHKFGSRAFPCYKCARALSRLQYA